MILLRVYYFSGSYSPGDREEEPLSEPGMYHVRHSGPAGLLLTMLLRPRHQGNNR